jgi:hypothetical protein
MLREAEVEKVDKYSSVQHMRENDKEGVDYRVGWRIGSSEETGADFAAGTIAMDGDLRNAGGINPQSG